METIISEHYEIITLKTYGSERLWKKWLWTPMKEMALNAYENDGSKFLWKRWP